MQLRKAAVSGVKWTSISTFTIVLVNLLKISILARILDKADFGLMALVSFILGFMKLFTDLGLSSAILHKQSITKEEYSSLYWINLIFSIILVLVVIAGGPVMARIYKEEQLTRLISIMSLTILLAALGKQFKTIEQKELNFRFMALVEIAGAIFGLIVAIVLAIKGKGVYSLVFGALTQHSITNITFLSKGFYTRGLLFTVNLRSVKGLFRIGLYKMGGQIVNYFNRDLDILIIGKIFGTEILGGYSLAKDLVRRPMQMLNPIISRVAMSLFPRLQNDQYLLRASFLKLLTGMGAVNAFIYGSIAILAPSLVNIFFGSEFESTVIYVQLFSAVMYFRSMGNYLGIIVITTGRTDYEFYWNLFVTVLMPLAVIAGARYSIEMIIILLIAVQVILIIPAWFTFYYKLIKLRLSLYLNSLIWPAGISSLVYLVFRMCLNNNAIEQAASALVLGVLLLVYIFKSMKVKPGEILKGEGFLSR